MTSDPTAWPAAATPPRARLPSSGGAMLRILHSRGVPHEGAVPLSPEGRGVSDALALGDPRLIDALWRDANRCRIAWRSEGWTLSNESRLLVCAINGRRVEPGEGAVLRVGHVLELGLARFLVDEAKLIDADADAEVVCGPRPGSLAPPVDLGGAGPADFSIDWDQLAPRAEVFPAAITAAAVARRAGAETEPLAELHEEFLRVARDPSQLVGRGDWDGFTASPADSAPTLAGLARQASVYATVRDIVLRREGIDEIIDAFDPGTHVEPLAAMSAIPGSPGMPDLPGMPETTEVLRLFMPGQAQAARALAPSLTRREHHALSPDSPMPISAARAAGRMEAQPTSSRALADPGAPHVLDE